MTKNPTNAPTPLWQPRLGSRRPLYRALVDALRDDLANDRLHVGDRLPTQRELARALSIGIGTVTRAYREAEREGLVTCRVGRGSFVALPPRSENLGLPDEDVIEMSVDLPLHAEDPDLGAALRKVARGANVQRLLRYQDHAGTARHRRAGAAWSERFGIPSRADDVVVCSGSQHALFVSLASVTQPGDVVLADELTYPGLRSAARELGLDLRGVKMDEGGTSVRSFASACARHDVRAAYLVPSFHNPTTRALDAGRREALAEIARRRDVFLVEDDVHRRVAEVEAPSLASLAPERTFAIASFSKAVAGGLRVAFLTPPRELRQRVVDAVWATSFMAAPLAVEVAATWIEDGTADEVVERKRRAARRRQRAAARVLGRLPFESQPSGFYLWLSLPEAWTSADFAGTARAGGVSVAPSAPFFIGASTPPAAVRVCLAAAETDDQARRGVEVLRELCVRGPGRAQRVRRS